MKRILTKLSLIAALAGAFVCTTQALHFEREAWRLKALAYHDFIPDAERLRAQGRLSEAQSVLEFVLAHPELPRQDQARKLSAAVQLEMKSWLAKAKRLGRGAVTGRGQNIEEMIGAISADMFIVGDVRDIAIQAWKYLSGGETDLVVTALSVVGLATTLAPEVDWTLSFLKLARRTGAMTRRFSEFLLNAARQILRTRSSAKVTACLHDTRALVTGFGPLKALGVMRLIETERDLKLAAEFAQHANKAAYPVLATGGRAALEILDKEGIKEGAEIAVEAAKRGPRGVAMATKMNPNVFRAHFCVGAGKSLWKGNLREAVALALSRLNRSTLLMVWIALALGLSGALTWTIVPLLRSRPNRTQR